MNIHKKWWKYFIDWAELSRNPNLTMDYVNNIWINHGVVQTF